MLDMWTPEPFNGTNKLKKFTQTLDEPKEPLPVSEPKPRYNNVITVQPRSGLYDIYKRTTDLQVNKCVGIGFTYEDATKFKEKRLKTEVDYDKVRVIFYDIVPQDNKDAKNPLWNSKEIMMEIDKYVS